MIAKKPEEIENLRMAGKILSDVLHEVATLVVPGVTAAKLDIAAEKSIRARGGLPAFLGYKPSGAKYPFPAALCVSINDEVVHGIPKEETVLKNGDIVSLDLGVAYKGYFSDSALTMCVGEADAKTKKFLRATHEALKAGIAAALAGGYTGDIGAAIEAVARENDLSIVEDLAGHGIGRTVHEKPFVPNAGTRGEGEKLQDGLVIAIEPIFAEGMPQLVLERDEWTYRTQDGSRAAHFEQTIIVGKEKAEILTPLR